MSSQATSGNSTPTAARIAVITTGGTIASTVDNTGALRPSVSGAELVAAAASRFPEGTLDVIVHDLGQLDSSDLTFADVDRITTTIAQVLSDASIDGVVVTHGTDTMEETAMAADVFHNDPRPVIFTGAQRSFDHPDSDGVSNLFEALAIATDSSARGIGVLIVFGHAVIPARGALKWHTSDPLAFATNAPEEPVRPDPLPRADLQHTRVDIVTAYQGADGAQVRAALAAGAQGIVVAGMGAGNVSTSFAEALAEAITSGVPVVMATRVPRGEVFFAYGGPGGGAHLGRLGVIGSGYVHAAQARVVLAAALACGVHPQTLF